jgi:hypothetical protein
MIQSLESNLSDFSPYNARSMDLSASRMTSASISQSKSMDLVFYTQEGDRVTLSSSAQVDAAYTTYEGMARAGGIMARQEGEAFQMTAGTQFSLSVQGDLSAQEMADIKKAVGVMDNIMNDLISGNYDGLVKKAGSLGQLDSLQSLSADLHYQRQIAYQQQTQMISATGDAAATATAADASATEGVPNTPEAAAVKGMMQAIQTSRVAPGKWMPYLNAYFSDLEGRTAARHPDDPSRLQQIRRVQSALLHRMGRMGRSD